MPKEENKKQSWLPQIVLRRKYKTICVFTDISLVERQWVKIREQADLLGNYFHVFNTLQE